MFRSSTGLVLDLSDLGGVEPWSWVDHVILAIGCLEASPTEEECVGLVEVRVLGIHWHDEVFGKSLLAVLALKFLGTVVIGDLVVTLKILGKLVLDGMLKCLYSVALKYVWRRSSRSFWDWGIVGELIDLQLWKSWNSPVWWMSKMSLASWCEMSSLE